MKVALAIFALVCVGLVCSETCLRADRCQHVNCDSGYDVACVNHECTCSPSRAQSCYRMSDCHGSCSSGWHCVDNKCYCRKDD